MIRNVYFHGPLGRLIEGPIRIVGDTIADVLEGASRQLPQLTPNPKTGRCRVAVVGCDTEEDLYRFLGDQEDIHIVPQVSGGKNAMTQVLIGAVLVGISFIPGIGATAAGFILKLGMITALGGISQMLAPTPSEDSDSDKNSYLGSPKNTTKIGTRIPILYGRYRWGGHFLSFDINAIEFRGTGAGGNSGGK